MRRKYANKWEADRAKREQINAYNAKERKAITFRFNIKSDSDIIAFIERLPNKIDFMRTIIREAIAKEKQKDSGENDPQA